MDPGGFSFKDIRRKRCSLARMRNASSIALALAGLSRNFVGIITQLSNFLLMTCRSLGVWAQMS